MYCKVLLSSHPGPGTGVVEVSHGLCDAWLEERYPAEQEEAG